MRRRQVVLVEDNVDHALLINTILTEEHIDVTHFHDAERALASLKNKEYAVDLLVFDLKLPNMSGLTLLKTIRTMAHHQQTPILMLTTSDNPQEIKACESAGANAYLTKPASFSALTNLLKTKVSAWLPV